MALSPPLNVYPAITASPLFIWLRVSLVLSPSAAAFIRFRICTQAGVITPSCLAARHGHTYVWGNLVFPAAMIYHPVRVCPPSGQQQHAWIAQPFPYTFFPMNNMSKEGPMRQARAMHINFVSGMQNKKGDPTTYIVQNKDGPTGYGGEAVFLFCRNCCHISKEQRFRWTQARKVTAAPMLATSLLSHKKRLKRT